MGDDLELDFSKAAEGVLRWLGRVELRRVKLGVFNAFDWLGDMITGVYVVLLQSSVVYNCVVVSGSRLVIIYRAEQCHLTM